MLLIHSNKNRDWKLNQVNEYYELLKCIQKGTSKLELMAFLLLYFMF